MGATSVPIIITAQDGQAEAVVKGLRNAFDLLEKDTKRAARGMTNAFTGSTVKV